MGAGALLVAGLGGGGGPIFAQPAPLTVAAASSLQRVLRELGGLYRARSGRSAVFAFASSGILARQIEHGAPFDLFLAADEMWLRHLAARGLILPGSAGAFAEGRLVLVTRKPIPPGGRLGKEALAALLGGMPLRHLALANPAHAPYGVAAREVLRRAGLWQTLRERVVLGENVRQALSFVESGNAEAGLVAEALVGATKLTWRGVDAALHDPVRHGLGIPRNSRAPAAAREFLAVLFSPPAAVILARNGLTPLPPPTEQHR